jgi:hypothetical protein
MTNFDFLKVLNASQDLMEKAACFFVWQALLLDDVVKQLAARDELHYEEQLALGLNYFVELHDIGVSDNL